MGRYSADSWARDLRPRPRALHHLTVDALRGTVAATAGPRLDNERPTYDNVSEYQVAVRRLVPTWGHVDAQVVARVGRVGRAPEGPRTEGLPRLRR